MTLVSKSFSEIVTFSRSSNATRVGPTGVLEYAPHNLALQSQTFDNASWNKLDATVTSNAIAAPDGTVTADKLIATTAVSTSHAVYQGAGSISANWTFSIYAKAGEYNRVGLAFSNTGYVFFNLTTGVQEGTVGLYITSYSITSVGNGWYRISFGSTVTASGTNIAVYLFNSTYTSGDPTFTGDGTSGIYLWGAQLAVGPYALDYTPTTSAAVYGPRFDYDPVTLAARGLLVEEQRTNLVTYSNDFGNAAWTKNNCSITAALSPSGDNTASLLVPSSTANANLYNAVAGSSATRTVSVYAKASGKSWVYVLTPLGGSGEVAWFNVSTGVAGATAGFVTSSIKPAGNGWYRCQITGTGVSNYCQFGVSDANGSLSATVNGSDGAIFWGAQLEAGSFATSLIPTLASTVTRSADVASVNTLSPWWNATESTIYSEFDTFSTNDAFPYALGTKNNNEVDVYRIGSNGNVATLMFTSTVLQNNSTIATGTALNATIKAAYAIKANDLAGSANGGAAVTDTTATLPSVSTLYLGARDDGTGPLNGHLRRLAVYPRRLTNAEIQALTS